jgi:dephospho-CoA kinase
MILLLNGSFGIGKTTVAKALRKRLPGSAIFDPELIGSLIRLTPWGRPDDYQDLPIWRRLTVAGIRTTRRFRRTVIVPMAFTNLAYLKEIRGGALAADPDVRHVCLTAPLEVVLERLSRRAAGDPEPWQVRRARECCEIHGQAAFAEHVPAGDAGPDEIAAEIAGRLAAP